MSRADFDYKQAAEKMKEVPGWYREVLTVMVIGACWVFFFAGMLTMWIILRG